MKTGMSGLLYSVLYMKPGRGQGCKEINPASCFTMTKNIKVMLLFYLHFYQSENKSVKSVSVSTSSFADRCSISGYCLLTSMIFTKVCLGLATIKGHSYILFAYQLTSTSVENRQAETAKTKIVQ